MPGGANKAQRVRDPVHDLIEFDSEPFEQALWQVIQTRPFQRLRRIRQLGFSELVFPGATHTRFAHSLGVFHTARQLMTAIESKNGTRMETRPRQVTLAASLVHDVGHGMFSHSFEEVGKGLDLPMARHETVSETLIRDSDISDVFEKEMGKKFASAVADVLARKEPKTLYDSIVSSQFDADRLDYMQRDRLMTGVQSSGIDVTWLMSNLEIGTVQTGTDEEASGTVKTLVVGPKAFLAAENYVLSLFHLYPNVYYHKTTRGAEKSFTQLMERVFHLVRRDHKGKVGLPPNHPIRRFIDEPEKIDNVLALDDTVFWGALHMMAEAKDPMIHRYATRLQNRKLPKCIDIRQHLESRVPAEMDFKKKQIILGLACNEIIEEIRQQASSRSPNDPQILIDEPRRKPYKRIQGSESPLNQIRIRQGENRSEDMARLSPVVASAETFEACRVYHDVDDTEGRLMVENIMRTHRMTGEDG